MYNFIQNTPAGTPGYSSPRSYTSQVVNGNLALCPNTAIAAPAAACEQQTTTRRKHRRPVVRFRAIVCNVLLIVLICNICAPVLWTGLQHFYYRSVLSDINSYYYHHWTDEGVAEAEEAKADIKAFGESSWMANISLKLGANGFTRLIRLVIYASALFGMLVVALLVYRIYMCICAVKNGKAMLKL